MFNNQNIQVKTKFQNARKSDSAKTNSSKTKKLPTTNPGRSTTLSSIERSPRYLNQFNVQCMGTKTKSKLQLTKAEPKKQLIQTADATRSMPNLKAKSVEICSLPRGRSEAATLNRISRPFVSTCRNYRPSSSKIFDYHLSREEQNYFGQTQSPMKSVPVNELQLLRSGQRVSYLETRYERSPDNKYNYPEATSWRYGWFHNKTT